MTIRFLLYEVLACFMIVLISCSSKEVSSVFSESTKTKYQLLSEGYKPTRLKGPDGETVLNDRLEKWFNDTLVSYSFQNGVLANRTMIIESKSNSLNKVQEHFKFKGFKQASIKDSSTKWAVYGPSGKFYYDIAIQKDHIICTHYFK